MEQLTPGVCGRPDGPFHPGMGKGWEPRDLLRLRGNRLRELDGIAWVGPQLSARRSGTSSRLYAYGFARLRLRRSTRRPEFGDGFGPRRARAKPASPGPGV